MIRNSTNKKMINHIPVVSIVTYLPRRSFTTSTADDGDDFGENEPVAVLLKGMPFGVLTSDIKKFFEEYKYLPTSIEIGLNREGKHSGSGCILFEDEGEAALAV